MDLFHHIVYGATILVTGNNLFYLFVGCLLGTLVGVLPGLGPPAALSILLPLTYEMSPASSLIMLSGIYYGAMYGGSTTSILVNIPGEAASVVTCFDGYKMALAGRAGPALGISAIGSFVAGTFGTAMIMLLAPLMVSVALKFGPSEFVGLLALSLTMVVNNTNTMEPTGYTWRELIGNILLNITPLHTFLQEPTPFTEFSSLPQDIQDEITGLIIMGATSNNLKEAGLAINTLAQVDKKLNTLINDPKYSLQLIKHLAQKFNCPEEEVCIALSTKAAKEHLAQYRAINEQDPNGGNTPLIDNIDTINSNNIEKNTINIKNLLQSPYINLNVKTNYGYTALLDTILGVKLYRDATSHPRAAILLTAFLEIAQLLLDHGADPEIANKYGETPLILAQQIGDQELIQMIQDAIAKKHGLSLTGTIHENN